MEHGHIVISYNLVTREEIEQLRTVLQGVNLYDEWGLTRFYNKIPEGTVALTKWGG